ncbi:unnamed protein product [Penicillium salamii]|nr:unnamed protein product [Penicillium salamii]
MSFKWSSSEGSSRRSSAPRPIYDYEDDITSIPSFRPIFENLARNNFPGNEDEIFRVGSFSTVFRNLTLYNFPPATTLPAPWPVTALTPRFLRPLPHTFPMGSVRNGDAAFDEGNYPLAIQSYTEALVAEPRAPHHYISRSVAYARLKPENGGPNYQAALQDAETALSIAADRGNREYFLSANFRRAVTLYQLGNLGDAAFLLKNLAHSIKNEEFPVSLTPQNSYRSQILSWAAKLEDMEANHTVGDPRWDITTTFFTPDAIVPSVDMLKGQLEAAKAGFLPATREPEDESGKPSPLDNCAPKSVEDPMPATREPEDKSGKPSPPDNCAPKSLDHPMPNTLRHDWFQTKEVVTVTFYAKPFSFRDVEVVVKILKDEASVALPIPGGEYFNMVMPLFAEINPEMSSYVTKDHKLEVKLHKVIPTMWRELLGNPKPDETRDVQARTSQCKEGKVLDCPKDSNQVLTSKGEKEPAKEQKKKPKVYVTAEDSDSEHGDDVDDFFKKLYASADPETRRAMNKSFTESQGTSLSTNWKDVSKEKVEPRQ